MRNAGLSIVKADSPPDFCLLACENFIGAYCSVTKYAPSEMFYITIDNFLGGISIAKKIQSPVVMTEDEDSDILNQSNPIVKFTHSYRQDKSGWISICGSDLLKQSFQDGYDCEERYVNERAESDFPGFTLGDNFFDKVDSPSEYLLQQCYSIPDAYCATSRYSKSEYYLVIDNYLGKHKIIKSIPDLEEAILTESKSKNRSIGRWYRVLIILLYSSILFGILSMFLIPRPISTSPTHEKSSGLIELIKLIVK